MRLIYKTDVEKYLPLAVNLDPKRLDMYAEEQEKIKLTQFLGRDLYAELLQNIDSADDKWVDLIDSIRPMLAYWTYAMYLERGNVFNTATGPVLKRTDSSVPLTEYEHKKLINSICNTARFYESELQDFLAENREDYPSLPLNSIHTGCKKINIRVNTVKPDAI